MNSVDDFLQKVYDEYLKEAEEYFKDELLFDRFLEKKRDRYVFRFSLYIKDKRIIDEKKQLKWLEEEYDEWGRLSLESRYWYFTQDEPYEKIKEMSQDIFSVTIQHINGKFISNKKKEAT